MQPASALQDAALNESIAAQRVLGLPFVEIGLGVAKSWGLPDNLPRAMRVPVGEPPARAMPGSGLDRQRWLGRMASEVVDAMLDGGGKGTTQRVEAIAEGYARALGLKPEQVSAASQAAQERLSHSHRP